MKKAMIVLLVVSLLLLPLLLIGCSEEQAGEAWYRFRKPPVTYKPPTPTCTAAKEPVCVEDKLYNKVTNTDCSTTLSLVQKCEHGCTGNACLPPPGPDCEPGFEISCVNSTVLIYTNTTADCNVYSWHQICEHGCSGTACLPEGNETK